MGALLPGSPGMSIATRRNERASLAKSSRKAAELVLAGCRSTSGGFCASPPTTAKVSPWRVGTRTSSCGTGQRASRIFQAIDEVMAEHRKRITTGELNQWLRETTESNPPPLFRNHRVKLFYISQVAVGPPTFILFISEPQGLEESYQRFLLRRMREKYGFQGTPLRLFLRKRGRETGKSRGRG